MSGAGQPWAARRKCLIEIVYEEENVLKGDVTYVTREGIPSLKNY
jgi:hypothetical protein